MSETKWTPGPWALETVQTSTGSCHKIGNFPSAGVRKAVPACVYADNIRIGLDDRSPIAVELRANARLISAAPELYSALADMVKAAEFEDWDGRSKEYTAAVSALAKARGEQP